MKYHCGHHESTNSHRSIVSWWDAPAVSWRGVDWKPMVLVVGGILNNFIVIMMI